MNRVLVTGASGFIGRHTLAPLLAKGWDVHATYARAPLQQAPAVHWEHCDLLAPGSARAVIEKVRPTHLLHLAWYAEPGKFWNSPLNVTWTRASLELAAAFAESSGKRLVASGTCAEYDWNHGYMNEALTPIAPSTSYGLSKDGLRSILQALAATSGVELSWGRVFFLYGPHEAPGRLISSVAQALLRGQPGACSHGNQIRDFLHVQDVAAAFVHLLECEPQGTFNIGSGQAVTVKEVVTRFASALNAASQVQFGARPADPSEPPLLVADNRKLLATGWTPQYSLQAGLEHVAQWWHAQQP